MFQRCVETTLEAKTPGKFITYPPPASMIFQKFVLFLASGLAFKLGPSFAGLKPQNRGQIASKQKCIIYVCVCVYTFIYIYIHPKKKNSTNQQRSSTLSAPPPPKKKKALFLQMLSCKVSISKDGSTSATFSH